MKWHVTGAYADVVDEPQVYETEVEADTEEDAERIAREGCRADNGGDPADPTGPYELVDVFVRKRPAITMLCVRDPDWENEYVFDGEVGTITIDVGASWNGYKDYASCLQAGDSEAVDYERSLLAEVADLAPDNPVRQRVEEFFSEARKP